MNNPDSNAGRIILGCGFWALGYGVVWYGAWLINPELPSATVHFFAWALGWVVAMVAALR